MHVKGSVVVITGASSGIGRAAALRFASQGAAVVLAARRAEALEEVAEQCRQSGATAIAVPTDVTDMGAVEHLARRAIDELGRIDIWVNNAAVTMFAPFLEAPLDEFRRVLDVNVMGYVHGVRAALPVMKQQGGGVIVNVSSVVGVVPQPYTHAYSMSKAAIRVLGASIRQELRLEGGPSRKVKVVSILPAAIDTPLFHQTANHTGREAKAMPPVYSAERVAHAIVNGARLPRREIVVGPMGRNLVMQAKTTPGMVERMMAMQVDKSHLARTKPARDSSGNLFEPMEGTTSVDGGWHGRRRTAVRRMASVAALLSLLLVVRSRRH